MAAADQAAGQAAAHIAEVAAARTAALGEAAIATGLNCRVRVYSRTGRTQSTDDWHTESPAVVAGGARAAVKAKMAARAQHRAELPEQVALPQQM